ncbi:MAG: hypothetical protein M3Y13_07825 [Armatimonadota bacterium]|nr:hypothetical protein [Armatimonadota bacterium]
MNASAIVGQVAYLAAGFSAVGCAGVLGPMTVYVVLTIIDFERFSQRFYHVPPFIAGCLALWVGAALVGLAAGAVSYRPPTGRKGLKASLLLLCLLPLILGLAVIAPKA